MDYRKVPVFHQRRSDSIGSYDAYRELEEPSSVDLLRTSIIRSIRAREAESQGFFEQRYDGSNSNQTPTYSNKKFTVVEVEHFDIEKSYSSLEDTESEISDLDHSISVEKGQTKSPTFKTEKNALNEVNSNNYINLDSTEINCDLYAEETKLRDNVEMVTCKPDEIKGTSESDANGLKLARRKFNDTIFEDCSTYNITCPNIDLRGEVENNPDAHVSPTNEDFVNINPVEKANSSVSTEKNLDEQTSLRDTFLSRVMDNEQHSPILPNRREICEPTDASSVNEDNDCIESSSERGEDHGESAAVPNKRKYSRRQRKRSRRKSKSKKPYIYECPKCGVSYTSPNKRMNEVACCLHCDLWTSVEPVFIKREKTAWNTCRIC